MEILDRDRIETNLQRRLAEILDEWRRKLRPEETGQAPEAKEERELGLLFLLLLLPIWEDSATQLLESGGLTPGQTVVGAPPGRRIVLPVPESELRVDALMGASWQARSAARLIVENTRQRMAEAFGRLLAGDPTMTEADFAALLDRLFGDERAENIAVTETTRARTGGFENGRSYFAERGLPLLAIWQTERDEKVCKVCGPLHGHTERVWSQTQPNGPPAHVNCRCELGYVAADGTELN